MKTVHIYHHNDLDGRVSGALMYEYFKRYVDDVNNYDVNEIDYSTVLSTKCKVSDGDTIVFVDYSFSKLENVEFLIDLMMKNSYKIIWIDHHKTSSDVLLKMHELKEINMDNPNIYFRVDTTRCATWLVYDYLKSLINSSGIFEVPNIVKYINSYDNWVFDMPNTKEFAYGIDALDYDAKSFFRIMFKDDSDIFKYSKETAALESKFINTMIRNGKGISRYISVRNKKELDYAGFEVLICDTISDTVYLGCAMNIHGNSLVFGDKINEYDFVCPFIRTSKGQWKYSLFTSRNDVDCSELAKLLGTIDDLGGGGHKKAAGFQTKSCIFDKGNTIIISKMPILGIRITINNSTDVRNTIHYSESEEGVPIV